MGRGRRHVSSFSFRWPLTGHRLLLHCLQMSQAHTSILHEFLQVSQPRLLGNSYFVECDCFVWKVEECRFALHMPQSLRWRPVCSNAVAHQEKKFFLTTQYLAYPACALVLHLTINNQFGLSRHQRIASFRNTSGQSQLERRNAMLCQR